MNEERIIKAYISEDAKSSRLTEFEKKALFEKIMKDVKRAS